MSLSLPTEPWFMLVTGPDPLDGGPDAFPDTELLDDDGAILDVGADFGVTDVGRGSPRG